MARYTASALVLGVHNWGDADKIVTLFTRERGLIRAAAFGARRPKSPLAAGLQMFNEIEAELTEGQRLDTVRTASLLHHPKKLSEDLAAMSYGSFVAEVVREFLPEKQPEPTIYTLLGKVFAAFETRNARIVALMAAYQLMEHTGLQLSYERCAHCGKLLEGDAFFSEQAGGALCAEDRAVDAVPYPAPLREFLARIFAYDWRPDASSTVTRDNLLAAEQMLIGYLQRLLGHPLKSLVFIHQLG